MSAGDAGVPTNPSASDGCTPSAGVIEFCPLRSAYRCGSTRWVDTQAYCGDNARLECIITGYPPESPATVQILLNDITVVDTINSTLRGGRVDATWVAKAPNANWRNARLRFRVNAAGVVCDSSNEFTFRKRPTTGWTLKNVSHAGESGFYPVYEKHGARLEADRVHYDLKLRTHGDPFNATKQTAAKTLIEGVWNDGFSSRKFHRTRCRRGDACDCPYDCCKADFRLDVNFLTSGEHVPIRIHADAPPAAVYRSNMSGDRGDWADPNRCSTTEYAHEVGHVLGQYDEYTEGGNDPSGVQPANAPVANLMKTASNRTVLNRHYRHALAFLNDNAAGDPYKIVPP